MSLEKDIMAAMKDAMKQKDQTRLAALRAVKSEILLAKTSGDSEELTETDEVKLVQKLVKQRRDSAKIYAEQNRQDLAEPELAQAAVLEKFLPEQMSEQEVQKVVDDIIAQTNASGMKDMGKVMGQANQKMAGRADGRTISNVVKARLQN